MLAAVYFVGLLAMAAASTPRRVGDGGEYMAMAMQLAAGLQPSVSPAEMQVLKRELSELGAGFESSLLDYPDLVSSDGRQDFLHFFLYPLIVAPLLPVVSALGFHPNWAFTFVNALLLSGALFVVSRSVPLIATVAAFVAPIVWWVDKAHTEAFLYACVVVAAVTVRQSPSLAVISFALAGAQNAAIGATYVFFAGLVWLAADPAARTRRMYVSSAIGAAIVAMPFLYTLMRLDRLSPMAEYAQPSFPSLAGIAAFVLEPNIGLLPSAPVYGVALVCGVLLLIGALRPALMSGPVPPLWWWPAVIQLLLLLAWTQNPNANHGGTPGVNRWVLSLLALGIPWLAAAWICLPRAARLAFNIVVAVSAVMSAAGHLPSRPENYLEPTALAARMWRAGWVHVTPAEVFAERVQGREPAFVPAHDGNCRVLLIANQQAPIQCVPPVESLPSACRVPGQMCYAVNDAAGTRFIDAPDNGFFHRAAEPSWPAGGPLAAGLRRAMEAANPTARVWRVDNTRRWRERLPDADISAVLSSPGVSVVYITRMSAEAYERLMQEQNVEVLSLLPSSSNEPQSTFTNVAVIVRRDR